MGSLPARVAITGIGMVTPLGCSVSTFWKAVCQGQSGVRPIASFDASDFPTQFAGEAVDFDPRDRLSPKTIRRSGRTTQMALVAADLAFEDAGWSPEDQLASRTATIIGCGFGSSSSVEEAYRIFFTEGWRNNHVLAVPMCMPSAPGSEIAMHYGLRGPAHTVSAACASGAAAIAQAADLVSRGVVRRALTGGAEALLLPGVFSIWCRLRVLSQRNDDPAGACAPFSADRDGLVLGEGACLLALERLPDAQARGAHIYAELAGSAATCDAESITAPGLRGEVDALEFALESAGMESADIGYIHAHGTGTKLNDSVETAAIKQVFGAHAKDLAVSSSKSMTGHTMGAAGAIGCAVTALALQEQTLPPTINLREPDPECDLDYVSDGARRARFDSALCNAFAFGGSNVTLALRRV
jgi:3-oxoacyl-[acyl-carrier-protein] synthase II